MKSTLNESELAALSASSNSNSNSTNNANTNNNTNNTNSSSSFGGIDYRMSIEDFITAAVEVDDSLIQAIQLVSRKRIFRRLKQRVGSLPVGSNSIPNTPSKQSGDQQQQQQQQEIDQEK